MSIKNTNSLILITFSYLLLVGCSTKQKSNIIESPPENNVMQIQDKNGLPNRDLKTGMAGKSEDVACSIALLKKLGNYYEPGESHENRLPLDSKHRDKEFAAAEKFPISQGEKLAACVYLEFDILPNGQTTNIRVIASFPKYVFDRLTTEALSKWKYKPSESGSKGEKVRLDFLAE